MGFLGTGKLAASKIVTSLCPRSRKEECTHVPNKRHSVDGEALHLSPGELVEVKTEKEILETLNQDRVHKGLKWMVGMSKFCGKRFRVLKKVQTIRLESNREMRRAKNTVLLEGVMCDGSAFYGCDRMCFYFWHEAWLRRAKAETEPNEHQD
jgi:hypothetical protein